MKILITDSADIAFEAPDSVTVAYFDERKPVPSEHLDAEALVTWAVPATLAAIKEMPNLRWIQSLAAGTDNFISQGLPDSVQLTSGRGLHNFTVTEHTVSLLLALVRQLPDLVRAQDEHRWAVEKTGAKPLHSPERVSTLIDAKVLIWGFGSIGQTLAPVLTALGAKVTGVARSAGHRAGYPVIPVDQIRTQLPGTDVLIMILPATPQTEKALSAELISLLPKRSLVCNVGRGSTVDEGALVAALRERRLAGAALDVMATEPLPVDSPLWDAPNTVLTPHIAGWRAHEANTLVLNNLQAFLAGEPLTNLVSH